MLSLCFAMRHQRRILKGASTGVGGHRGVGRIGRPEDNRLAGEC